MSDTYKAIFECPENEERVVWYVSSRRQAGLQFPHHKNRTRAIKRFYDKTAYTERVEKVFTTNSSPGYDVSPFGYGA